MQRRYNHDGIYRWKAMTEREINNLELLADALVFLLARFCWQEFLEMLNEYVKANTVRL